MVQGLLRTLNDHEAHEVNLDDEIQKLLQEASKRSPNSHKALIDFEDEFVKRAVAALVQCECQKG